tara:strand:- start:371 stop:1279 length:909 start_codon:yes stop_codon:yes gene_type:complete
MSLKLKYSEEVKNAKKKLKPILALESTIIAHGMPFPQNLEFALEAESACKSQGVTPATTAIIDGTVCVGLEEEELDLVSSSKSIKKVSMRELGLAVSLGWSGATTVSSTMHIAKKAGIKVFATGGIGGVHRGADQSFDISQDLAALSKLSMVVVSAGAKSVLDLPKTVELLETLGVCLVGFKTSRFPSFYSRNSGIKKITKVNSVEKVSEVFLNNRFLESSGATLVLNPTPTESEIPLKTMDPIIDSAIAELNKRGIKGKMVTPFLLGYIHEKTKGKSLDVNISLALNNVQLGARIAKSLNA